MDHIRNHDPSTSLIGRGIEESTFYLSIEITYKMIIWIVLHVHDLEDATLVAQIL